MGTAFFFQREPRRPRETPKPEKRDHSGEDSGRLLVCGECLQAVTTGGARIEMSGGHVHTFANPHGVVFHIGCFAVAPGCQEASEPSPEFSWFPGYTWEVALCRGCGAHLGWLFRSGDSRFHALILDRLAEADEPKH